MGFPGLQSYEPEESWKWILGLFGLLAWGLLLVLAVNTQDFRRKIIFYCAAPVIFMFNAHFILPNQVEAQKAPVHFS